MSTKPPPRLHARIYEWRDGDGNRTPGIGLLRGTSLRGFLSAEQALDLSNDLVDLAEQLQARDDRPEIVARIHEAGLSKREAARTAGVDEGTVRNDLRSIEGAENSAPNDEPDDEIIDAEIVDDEPSVNTSTGELE